MMRWSALLIVAGYTYGLHWIFISLHDYGHMPAWLAALATLLLAIYVSLFLIAALACCQWLIRRSFDAKTSSTTPWLSQWSTPLVAAAIVTLFEMLRGWLFTGFPWLAIGYLVIDTPLSGWAKILGVYGVGFLAVACLTWVVQALWRRSWKAWLSVTAIVVAGFVLQVAEFTQPQGKPLRVALIQGAIPQSMKFDPSRERDSILQQLQLARIAAEPGGAKLFVFPETALIRPWQDTPIEVREAFHGLGRSNAAAVMLGVPMRDADGFRNSLIALDGETPAPEFRARYDKQHLVPFGEFIPFGFRWFVDQMQMPLGDFQRGTPDQVPIPVDDQFIGVNICYEDLFGEEIIQAFRPTQSSSVPRPHPTILLNVSNLAWFGDTIALSQHLDIARMRSIETGRPSIRSTNTGATAIISHQGRVLDLLPFNQPGLLYGQVQGMSGTTPYSQFGNLPIGLISLALLGLGLAQALRAGRKS